MQAMACIFGPLVQAAVPAGDATQFVPNNDRGGGENPARGMRRNCRGGSKPIMCWGKFVWAR